MHPLTDNEAERATVLGEDALMERLRDWLGEAAPPAPHGPGDDTAVLPVREPAANLLTVDCLLHARHFDDSVPPEEAGAKLLLRNLSDIAAMGGMPHDAVVAFFGPEALSLEWLERFTRGLAACARQYGIALVGGDLSRSHGDCGASLTLTGHAARPLLRKAARPGDRLWVSGALGGSLPSGRHTRFTPRLREGQWLAAAEGVRGAMDLSDGLGLDLPRFLAPGTAAALEPEAIPLHGDARAAAHASGHPPLWHALHDGEDYELLFATAANLDEAAFVRAYSEALEHPPRCIGKVVDNAGGALPLLHDAADRTALPAP